MSFGNTLKSFGAVQEVLILALMLVTVYALFYIPEISLMYKIGIGILVFSVIFLVTLAAQILRQQQEIRKAQQK